MEHQRPHLDRPAGDVEVGLYDATANHQATTKHAPAHAEAPRWLKNWEKKRPVWLVEMIAEFFGVFMYCYCGVGATAAFFISSAEKETGFGSILNVAFAYMLGITFAVIIAGPVSGGHLSPAFTLAFTVFKGFPARKIPQYIIAQIMGGFVACLCVYAQYKVYIDGITEAIKAAYPTVASGNAAIFSPTGTGGIFGTFPGATQPLGQVFMNELFVSTMLALVVFTVLDPTNAFVGLNSAAFIIGAAFLAMITAFSGATTVLNTARDLGGRLACAAIFGSGAFTSNPKYTAIAALTNILGTFLGASLQIFFLSDHRRPVINGNPGNAAMHAAKESPEDHHDNESLPSVNRVDKSFTPGNMEKGTVQHQEYQ